MITVLRLGHRVKRDKRVTTHCGLVSRALLADAFVISGEEDRELVQRLNAVSRKWGGKFKASYVKDWKAYLKKEKKRGSILVHLTFYGLPFQEKVAELRKKAKEKAGSEKKGRKDGQGGNGREVIVIVGAEKVPREVYEMADYNLSVTSQPHSEIAALALFLDYWHEGKELAETRQKQAFGNALVRIIPKAKGKRVVRSK